MMDAGRNGSPKHRHPVVLRAVAIFLLLLNGLVVAQNETLGHRETKGAIRSIGSASCFSPAPSDSMTPVRAACCSACALATPVTRPWAPGWPRSR